MKYFSSIDSPVGELIFTARGSSLTSIAFARGPTLSGLDLDDCERNDEPFRDACLQLNEYFDGERRSFDLEIGVDRLGTPFQQEVWSALARIPYGETRSYKDIAEAINRPRAFRAVGQANHHNPFVIVIPCHRVVGCDGSLTGFGGGLDRKEALLKHEGWM